MVASAFARRACDCMFIVAACCHHESRSRSLPSFTRHQCRHSIAFMRHHCTQSSFASSHHTITAAIHASSGIWKMDEPVGVGVWRKKDRGGNWISEKSEFDPEASKRRADHLDHFLKLPSFQQRYELEVKSRDSVRDARQCAGAAAPHPPLTRTFIKHSRARARVHRKRSLIRVQTMRPTWRREHARPPIARWK